MQTTWTKEETDWVRDFYPNFSNAELLDIFWERFNRKITEAMLSYQRWSLGLDAKHKKIKWHSSFKHIGRNDNIYFIRPKNCSLVKIGVSCNILGRALSYRLANPVELTLLYCLEGSKSTEKQIHYAWADHRKHGEWFQYSDELIESIEHHTVLNRIPTKTKRNYYKTPKDLNFGCVYFIEAEETGCVKIGVTKNLKQRFSNLKASCGFKLNIRKVLINGSPQDEMGFHEYFKQYRIHGEWFKIEGALKEFLETKEQETEIRDIALQEAG